jgi:PAS domain S-box-containing protein
MRLKPIAPSLTSPPASRRKNRERVTLWAGLALPAAASAWAAAQGGLVVTFIFVLLLLVCARLTNGFRVWRLPAQTAQSAATLAEVRQQLAEATARIAAQAHELSAARQATEREKVLCGRLSMAVEAIGISPWEMDFQTRQFMWDYNRPKALGLEGVRIEQLAASLQKLIHPEDFPLMQQVTAAAVAGECDLHSYRLRVLLPDGTTAHMQTHFRINRDANGVPVSIMGAVADTTSEVQTTQLLQRQMEQERRLLDRLSVATHAAAIVSWEVDLASTKFLWIENTIRPLDGASGMERALTKFAECVHPDDRYLFGAEIGRAAKEGRDLISYRWRCFSSDGALVHMQSHAKLYFNESRRATRALGVSWEITKEIEATEQLARQTQQLRDTERRLERASLSSSEGHWEWDLVAQIAWYSTSFHTLLGYQIGALPADLLASLQKLQHPDDVEWQRGQFRRHIGQGEPYDFECRLRLASDEYRWVRIRGTAERDAQGRAVAMSGSIQDIHQQKAVEDALKLAQRRLERAITGTQDGLWELEADGQAWCSPRVFELLGYTPDELASGTNFLREFLHPDDTQAVAAATRAHFQQGSPYDVEIRLRTKSGGHRWYRARAAAERDGSGRPLRVSGSLQDVTEARAVHDELLRATEAAEAANRAKSSFLANVSHEIRTPMNGIIGMTGLLLDTSLDRTQRDYADTIRSSADSLLIVINDILDFSKIEAGKLAIESLELEPRGSVEDVAAMMACQAADKNLEIIVDVAADVPQRVLGDPQRLRQCLINLMSNAIKFTHSGEIVIEVRTAGHRDGNVLVRFEVRDTGMGIAASALGTLFQPFVQADSSTTRHYGGTGLGLSIVDRLAQMMGGQVGAASEVGKGSTFWFTLPMEALAAPAAAAPLDLARVGLRVLIVEDNATCGKVLADQLRHAGYEVSLATSGVAALSLMYEAVNASYPYDIVLVGYQLTDMEGMALGEKISVDAALTFARVVMLTPLNRHGDMRRLAALGFAGYLTKPVRARELFACLDRVMSRERGEWHLESQPLLAGSASHEVQQSNHYVGKVLLTEDNLVNQKVATRFLERLGCGVRIANNGVEAVKAWQEERFALIFMDLQMPVMDGLTATRRIRELEGGGRSTPIVALTANAMVGQLETCLEAGMNGFLTKPLEVARLRETLDRFGLGVTHGSAPNADASAGGSAGLHSAAAPIELARWREITDGDTEFAQELAQTFIVSGAEIIDELQRACGGLDRVALSRAAHKLTGASANIHAESLRVLSSVMESQAAFVEEAALVTMLPGIEREYRRVVIFFNEQAELHKQRTTVPARAAIT